MLEQGNDDLEREHRNAHSSFLDIESKYNRLVEEKVLLEEELRMKTALVDEVQRMKDVVRGGYIDWHSNRLAADTKLGFRTKRRDDASGAQGGHAAERT